jgi:hypothetical protein
MQFISEKQLPMKQYDYVITLKNAGFFAIDAISKLMLFISFTIFVYSAYTLLKPASFFYTVVAFVLLTWFIIINCFKKNNAPIYYSFGLLIAAIGWLYNFTQSGWLTLVFVLAAFLEKQVKFPQEIGVDKQGLTFNSFPKKHQPWKELNNLILKDGLLTVDYKNNKLFQQEIESQVSSGLETEFNEFCSAKVKANSQGCSNI